MTFSDLLILSEDVSFAEDDDDGVGDDDCGDGDGGDGCGGNDDNTVRNTFLWLSGNLLFIASTSRLAIEASATFMTLL